MEQIVADGSLEPVPLAGNHHHHHRRTYDQRHRTVTCHLIVVGMDSLVPVDRNQWTIVPMDRVDICCASLLAQNLFARI